MKLLIYSHSFAPAFGGVETYGMALARGLAEGPGKLRADAVNVTVATKTDAEGFSDPRLPFHIVRQPAFWRLFRLVRNSDAVLVIGPCISPMFLAWLLRRPFAVEQHGYQSICPNGLLLFEPTGNICPGHFMAKQHTKCWKCNQQSGTFHSLKLWLATFPRRWLSNLAGMNISISHHVDERLQLRNSRVVYYGIPDISHGRKYAGDGASKVCFAYAGRLVREKGLETLVDAAALLMQRHPDFDLKFIGDGPERHALQERVERSGLNSHVLFTGFLAGQGLRQALDEVDVMIMPSKWEETAGLSAIEQMMRGRLVICSDIGGLGEVVDGAGLKFPVGDSVQLARLMQRVIEEPQIVQQFAERARSRAVKLFSEDRMIAEHWDVLNQIARQQMEKPEAVVDFQ